MLCKHVAMLSYVFTLFSLLRIWEHLQCIHRIHIDILLFGILRTSSNARTMKLLVGDVPLFSCCWLFPVHDRYVLSSRHLSSQETASCLFTYSLVALSQVEVGCCFADEVLSLQTHGIVFAGSITSCGEMLSLYWLIACCCFHFFLLLSSHNRTEMISDWISLIELSICLYSPVCVLRVVVLVFCLASSLYPYVEWAVFVAISCGSHMMSSCICNLFTVANR